MLSFLERGHLIKLQSTARTVSIIDESAAFHAYVRVHRDSDRKQVAEWK